MTFAMSMFNNTFPCIQKRKTIISSFPTCYVVSARLVVFRVLSAIEFSNCAHQKKKVYPNVLHLMPYTITSIMLIPILYPKTLGNGCAQFKSLSPPQYIVAFEVKIAHQKIQTTHSKASHCHYSMISHATLFLYYRTSMLTL